MSGLVLSLLGPLLITNNGQPFSHFRARTALALCIYLACEREAHSREKIMALLWPDWAQSSAQQNLRQSVYVLRQVLPTVASWNGNGSVPLVLADREKLQLNQDAAVTVDVHQFESLLKRATPESLQEAIAFYRGDFLSDFYLRNSNLFEEWVSAQREICRGLALGALDQLTNLAFQGSDFVAAEAHAWRQLKIDNLRENAYRQLMLALNRSGRRSDALTQYEICRRLLRKELGIEPDIETRSLAERIAAGDKTPVSRIPGNLFDSPVEVGKRSRHNLPMQLSSFIGRKQEITEITTLLSTSRLTTLTGVGGSGKTRLAMQAARQKLDSYADGIWLVDLAPLSDPTLLPSLVVTGLGLSKSHGVPDIDAILGYLRERNVLLLLDNCEHLIEAVSRLLGVILENCPGTRILATSREPLNITGEFVWQTPTLPLPDQNVPHPFEELPRFDAIRLFMERATTALPSFQLTAANAEAVVQLCRRLDGIPMAIELAAVWVKLLKVEQIVARLDDRFRLLVWGERAAPPRHQTLRALIDWSYDWLLPAEQRLLRRLSVFAGTFSLEAVEAICDDMDEGNVLELMFQLANKSLVVVSRVSGQETRYSLHETIRQYGREKLVAEGQQELMQNRHASYYARLAETAEPQLYRADQIYWFNRLKAEYGNLRHALDWTLSNQGADVEAGLRLTAALSYFWEANGYLTEGHHWLESALKFADTANLPLRARFYLNAGNFMFEHCLLWEESFAPAFNCAEKALALYNHLEDETGIAWAMRLKANCLWGQDTIHEAIVEFEDALSLAEEIDDKVLQARIYQNLGRAKIVAGDLKAGEFLGERGLAIAREIGDRYATGYLSFSLGLALARQGDYEKALTCFQDALAVCRTMGLKVNAIKTLNPLGDMARLLGRYDEATKYYLEYLALAEETEGWLYGSEVLSSLGHIAIRRHETRRAVEYFRESVSGDGLGENPVWNLMGLALVSTAREQDGLAARLYGAIDKTFDKGIEAHFSFPVEREDYLRDVALVRDKLGEAAFTAAWSEGANMTPKEAITLAFRELDEVSVII